MASTYEELIAKSRELAAAGDMDGARRVAQIAIGRRDGLTDAMGFPTQPAGGSSTNTAAVNELRDKGRAAATGMANGMSFGFGDNIAGAIGGVGSMMRGQGFARGYDDTLDIAREGMARDQQANPMAYGGGNLVGAAVPAVATAGMATGATGLGTLMRGIGLGATEGGLQGAGAADGQDVTGQALRGAGIGAIAGGAAPIALGVGRSLLKNPVTGVIDNIFNIANNRKAGDAIGGALRSSGKTQQEITDMLTRAAQQGQPEYRVMDALGVAGQRQASGVARAGGDAATEIAEFLARRQADQGDRVGSFVEDAFGVRGTTAAKTSAGLTQARGDVADVAYDAARGNAAPVDVRGAIAAIDDRIGGMQGSGVAGDGIDGKLAGYRSRLAAQPGPDGVTRELSDFNRVLNLKRSVQDDIGAAVRAGRNNEARELGKLANELDAALEGSSDMYRTANDGFREASRVIKSVDDGAAMSARGRAADNVPAFNAMTPDMQGAARVGYGDDLLNKLERVTSPTSNRAKPLQSTKRSLEADAMATDAPLYSSRLNSENAMWETQNRALGGSRTADNTQDIAAMNELSGGVFEAGRDVVSGNFGNALSKTVGILAPLAKGQNEATRALIAKALMSDDPVASLAPLLRKETSMAYKRRIIEGFMRQGPGEADRSLQQ